MTRHDEPARDARTGDGAGGGDGPTTGNDSGVPGAFSDVIRGALEARRLTLTTDGVGRLRVTRAAGTDEG